MKSAAFLLPLMVLLSWAPSLGAQPVVQVPLALHVAEVDGVPVASDEFVRAQIEAANDIYRRIGVALVPAVRRSMPRLYAALEGRADRDALAARVVPRMVNVFVVAKLMDVDEPGRERRGVHWHVRGPRRTRFVIVSAISGPYVLAHELGHFFGNAAHSDVTGNLMSYQHTDQAPTLDATQVANVQRTVRAMRARGELRAP